MISLSKIENKLLYVTLGSGVLGTLLLLIAVCTPHWVQLTIPQGVWRNESHAYVISHHSGLWRICRKEKNNQTNPVETRTYCRTTKFFPPKDDVSKDPDVDMGILDYSRSEAAFAMISLVFSILAHLSGFYTLKEPRYMFKRLAGMLFLITAICLLVSVEVMINSVNYERKHLPTRHPRGSYLSYGFSFGLSWVSFIIFTLATIVFFICSRKRKGVRARSIKEAEENEPVVLGRI